MNRGTKGSGEGQKAAMTEEFQQIVRGADEFPFPLDAGEATKTETAQEKPGTDGTFSASMRQLLVTSQRPA